MRRSVNELGYVSLWSDGSLRSTTTQLGNPAQSGSLFDSTQTIPLSTWTHFAFVSDLSGSRYYIDGTLAGTTVRSAWNGTAARPAVIGNAFHGGYQYIGYIDDLRITKNLARYTSNFTPPTRPLTIDV
jgi:hypothetical protein